MDMKPATNNLPDATMLAVDRTCLAHDRTLMAWVRTATSLISFGFTMYKFFQYLREEQGVVQSGAIGPREFALLMIGIGIAALLLATVGHYRNMRALRDRYGTLVPFSGSAVLAALVGVLGLVLFVAVLLRQ